MGLQTSNLHWQTSPDRRHLSLPTLADGVITASVDGDFGCGKYGVLLSGLRDGHKFRRYKSEGINITEEGESSDTVEIKTL